MFFKDINCSQFVQNKKYKIKLEFNIVIDFKNALLIPKSENQLDYERAKITIEILGLNNEYLVLDRKNVTKQYLFLYNTLKEKTEQEDKIFNPNDYKELDIDNYSYRFFLKRALKYTFTEKNEFINEINIKKYFGIQNFVISDLSDKREIYSARS